ncbi:MAG TPA: OmpA family protein [Acidobacteriaceae bacterium]|nr:OmpA family protein [Acidobacteriaceae bacterium]
MRMLKAIFLLVVFGGALAVAQRQAVSGDALNAGRFDVAVGYNFINANAPPASCGCFSMNGGFAAVDYQPWDWLGITGKVTGGHADNVSTLGQDLTLLTFLAGPRVSLSDRRISPFGQALFGVAKASDSYFPTSNSSETSASSFAFSAGGGADLNLNERFAIRLADIEYLRTAFPNGAGNTQNHLEAGFGLVFRFGGHGESMEQVPLPQRSSSEPAGTQQAGQVALTCSGNAAEVTVGDLVQVVGNAVTLPARSNVTYSWASSGGAVDQQGHIVTIDTAGLAPGEYRVTGRATLDSDSSVNGGCTVLFHVKAAAPAESAPADTGIGQDDFHANVKDAFFDYDSSTLRPDAQQAAQQDIAYLAAHPELQITINGYADERGSTEFNLALGLDRANAMRTVLIDGGIDGARIEVITYGKEKPFCTEDAESCYQQNRRAQIVLRK